MSLFQPNEGFKSEIERVQAYQSVFANEMGARVLYDMAVRAKLFDITQNVDPGVLAAHQGERNVILRIQKILETSLEKIKDIMKEESKNAT